MLAKKKVIIVKDKYFSKIVYKRINKEDGIDLPGPYPCRLCNISYFNCSTKTICYPLYCKFYRIFVYVR